MVKAGRRAFPFSWKLRPLPPVPLPSRIRSPSALAVLPAGAPSPGPVPAGSGDLPGPPVGSKRGDVPGEDPVAPDRTQSPPGAPGAPSPILRPSIVLSAACGLLDGLSGRLCPCPSLSSGSAGCRAPASGASAVPAASRLPWRHAGASPSPGRAS